MKRIKEEKKNWSYNKGRLCLICNGDHRVAQLKDTGDYYCCRHYNQMRTHGRIIDEDIKLKRSAPRLCEYCGAENSPSIVNGKRYCGKHYAQLMRSGMILEETIKDDNQIVLYDTYIEIVLKNKDLIKVARTVLDLEDYEFAKKYKWHYTPDGYSSTRIKNRNHKLHRLLLKPSKDNVIDHIDGDGLNNRRCNLREVSQQENMKNRHDEARTESGTKGVYWHKLNKKWYVRIGKVYGGTFDTIEEAITKRKCLK